MHRIIGVCAATCLLAACGGSDERTIQTEDGEVTYDIDSDGGESTFTFEGEDGGELTMQTGSNVDADLPDGYSVYPGSTVVSSTNMKQADGEGSMVLMTTDDSPDEVVAYYRAQAEAVGITIQSEITANGNKLIGGEGPDGSTFSVNASPSDDGTTVQLLVGRGLN